MISNGAKWNCCRWPLLVAFKIPDIYFSPPVLFIQLTFHSWAPWGYILFKDPLKRHSCYNDFQRHWISEISNCYQKTVKSWVQIHTNSQTAEITDPLYGFLLCLCWTHTELPDNFSFGFSVVHNSTLSKILEIKLNLILARQAKDCCRSPLLVHYRLSCLSNWRSILELHLFKDALKRHSRYNAFQHHCRLIKCSPVCTREIYALPQPLQT